MLLRFLSWVVVLLLVASPEGASAAGPKPKKVKCQNKNYLSCYHKELYCPTTCARDCLVDCSTCQPVCPPSPPIPPKKVSKVKCKDKKLKKTCSENLFCPDACPSTCVADCVSCSAVCPSTPSYSPPPPPVVTPSPYPPPPVVDPSPPPPPPVVTPSPYPPPPVVDPSPPPPPVVDPSPPPPPPVVDPSPPPPPVVDPSPPPPAVVDPSPPPPPPVVDPSPPPPPVVDPSPPPPVVTPSPPPIAAGVKRVRCRNKSFTSCYLVEHQCPEACPGTCEVDCTTCSPVCSCNRPGAVCEDPRFIGADGITFYFHGKKDKDFCIVSDTNLHINAHFIGRRNANMGRDFTWVQSLGILFNNHQLFIGAKKTSTWDEAADRLELSFDSEPVFLSEEEGAKWQPKSAQGVSITRSRDTNAVIVEVEGNFKIKASVVPITEKDSRIHNYGITEEDCFAHLDLRFKFYSLSGDVNGVLFECVLHGLCHF